MITPSKRLLLAKRGQQRPPFLCPEKSQDLEWETKWPTPTVIYVSVSVTREQIVTPSQGVSTLFQGLLEREK